MLFNVIGTGNMGWFMAKRLNSAGHTCLGIYGRNQVAAQELARELHTKVYTSLSDIADNADCCILAVSDHEIEKVAGSFNFPNTVLLHTAGAVSSSTLALAAQNYGVVWPVYSILKSDLPTHRNIPCLWEANSSRAKEVVINIATSISSILYEAGSQQRKWMHLSAVLGNNFTNHLFAICEGLCEEQELPFSLLQPILKQTFDRLQSGSPVDMQSGPARRNDAFTLQQHEILLQQHPEWREMYKTISRSIIEMYRDKNT